MLLQWCTVWFNYTLMTVWWNQLPANEAVMKPQWSLPADTETHAWKFCNMLQTLNLTEWFKAVLIFNLFFLLELSKTKVCWYISTQMTAIMSRLVLRGESKAVFNSIQITQKYISNNNWFMESQIINNINRTATVIQCVHWDTELEHLWTPPQKTHEPHVG